MLSAPNQDPLAALERPRHPLDCGDDAARQDAARTRLWAAFFEASGVAGNAWDPAD
jgi:hypothetical protein